MSKVLFFNIPAHGHTYPTLPLVAELVRRGVRARDGARANLIPRPRDGDVGMTSPGRSGLDPAVELHGNVLEAHLPEHSRLRVADVTVEEGQGVSGVITTHERAHRVDAELPSRAK